MTAPSGAPLGNGNGSGHPAPALPVGAAQPQPVGPAPGPVPMTFQIGQATGVDGKTWAVLICYSTEGVRHMFLDPATAQTIGSALLDIARAGNIQLPPPGLILGN